MQIFNKIKKDEPSFVICKFLSPLTKYKEAYDKQAHRFCVLTRRKQLQSKPSFHHLENFLGSRLQKKQGPVWLNEKVFP